MATGRGANHVRAATLILIVLGLSVSGCKWLLGNVSFNINIPLGLNGTTGLLNPDGGVIGPGVEPPQSNDDDVIIPPDDL